jgi:hypothetical protein
MVQVKFTVRIRALGVAYCVDTCKEALLITASQLQLISWISGVATT